MKKIISILMIAAIGLMVGCTGQIEKEVKVIKNDSVIEKDVTIKMGSCMHDKDSCNMKCCNNKVCDSLCQELSKVICKIVELKVKQSMCMMQACKEKEGCKEKCDKNCKTTCPGMKKAEESKEKK
jgi:hypothetical protein